MSFSRISVNLKQKFKTIQIYYRKQLGTNPKLIRHFAVPGYDFDLGPQAFVRPQTGMVMAEQAPLVPTGTETCPNRVVGGTMGPCIRPSPPHLQQRPAQYPGFPQQESWEGKEPLIDLGAFPTLNGVANPRMGIPTPNNMRELLLCTNQSSATRAACLPQLVWSTNILR